MMKKLFAILLTVACALGAWGAADTVKIGNITVATPSPTNYVLGATDTNSSGGFARLYSFAEIAAMAATNTISQLGVSNANVKPLISPHSGGTNKLFAAQAGANIELTMTSTSIVHSLSNTISGTKTFQDSITFSSLTASRPVLSDGSKVLSSGLIDLTSATHVSVPHTNNAWTTNGFTNLVLIQSTMAVSTITNLLGTTTPGTFVHVFPGTYHIPTNNTSWLRPGVDIYFSPGARFICGHNSDTTIRKWFSDEAAATTNFITGDATFVYSNNAGSSLGAFVVVTNPASVVVFEAVELSRLNDTAGSPAIHQRNGSLTWRFKRQLRCLMYDCYWGLPQGDGLRVNGYSERLIAGDTGVEFSGSDGAVLPGNASIAWGTLEADPSGPGVFSSLLDVNATCALRGQQIIMNYGGYLLFRATGTNVTTLDCPIIKSYLADFAELQSPIRIEGNARIIGAHINTVTNIAGISFQNGTPSLELVNCKITTDSATLLSISTDAGSPAVTVSGTLSLDKPVATSIALNGGQIIGPPLTNSYSGTNVVWNIGAHTHQVVNVTNGMLLILTNATSLTSGKQSTLTLYNDKATNMPIAITSANRRLFGLDAALLNGANSLTNARSMVITAQLVGTNITLQVEHQR